MGLENVTSINLHFRKKVNFIYLNLHNNILEYAQIFVAGGKFMIFIIEGHSINFRNLLETTTASEVVHMIDVYFSIYCDSLLYESRY